MKYAHKQNNTPSSLNAKLSYRITNSNFSSKKEYLLTKN